MRLSGVRAAYAMAAAVATHRRGSAASGSSARPPRAIRYPTPVIAVMPFKNLSPEPDSSDYFVDGLTSEVIRNLCWIDGLEVRSQTSSFSFKNKARDLQMIGKQLNANHIVEGDVLRVGNRLRINVQLVQIAGDVPLWTGRFDRTLDDVFAIQDEISLAIVNKLRLTLGTGQRRYHTNVKAYDLYLRGRRRSERQRPVRGAEAAKLFEQVIAMDPDVRPGVCRAGGCLPDAMADGTAASCSKRTDGDAARRDGGTRARSRSLPKRTRRWASPTRMNGTGRTPEVIRACAGTESNPHADSRDLRGHGGAHGAAGESDCSCSKRRCDHGSPVAGRAAGPRVRAVRRRPLRGGDRERAADTRGGSGLSPDQLIGACAGGWRASRRKRSPSGTAGR